MMTSVSAVLVFTMSIIISVTHSNYADTPDCCMNDTDLVIGADPLITIEDYKHGTLTAACEAVGWFPEPAVMWKDSEGKWLESSEKISMKGQNRLFNVKTAISIKTPSKVFCSVRIERMNLEKVLATEIGETFFKKADHTLVYRFVSVAICLIVCAIVILIIILLKYKYFCRRLSTTEKTLSTRKNDLTKQEILLATKKEELDKEESAVKKREDAAGEREKNLGIRKHNLAIRDTNVAKREEALAKRVKTLESTST